MHCPILHTDGMGCEWCMERLNTDKSFFQPDPSQNYDVIPRWIRDQNKVKEEPMTTYFTKCGLTFEKPTKAETTGYHIEGDEHGAYNGKCAECPFVISVKEGYPDQRHKRWECRAGSQPPNHETTWRGSLDDKCTLSIYSLDVALMTEIIAFAQGHQDLSAAYNADSQADCRRTISVSCSGNKKGIAAKKELIEKFFPKENAEPAPDDLSDETEEDICGDCSNYEIVGKDIGRCEINQTPVSSFRPACKEFDQALLEDEDLDNIESMDLENQLDVLLGKGDAEDAGMEVDSDETDFQNKGHACGSCEIGHWYSFENTYVNVCQDDGKTVKRPCKAHTHYCYQFEEGQRKIAEDKDFDPETAPRWCPLGEVETPTTTPKKKPRIGSLGCQEMRDDCPLFCAHNDGCAVLISIGGALKRFLGENDVDCDVFRERKAFVCGGSNSATETPEIVTEQPETVNESVPEVIKPAEMEQVPTFDYSEIDADTTDTLHYAEDEIVKIRMQSVYDIGKCLKLAHDALAKAGSGKFGAWCESIGFSRRTAENYLQAHKFICENFAQIEDAAGIQPSLLFAASKPSAPPELAQAVIDGDITKHKDYMEAMDRIKQLNQTEVELRTVASDLANDKTMLEIELQEAKKTSKEWHSAYDVQRAANREQRNGSDPEDVQRLVNQQVEANRKIFSLEQEIKKLNEQLDAKPIVITAEIEEHQDPDVLKPCPFCGGKAEFHQFANPKSSYSIECTVCRCGTYGWDCPSTGTHDENKAMQAERWNRREGGTDQ